MKLWGGFLIRVGCGALVMSFGPYFPYDISQILSTSWFALRKIAHGLGPDFLSFNTKSSVS